MLGVKGESFQGAAVSNLRLVERCTTRKWKTVVGKGKSRHNAGMVALLFPRSLS